jgi:hypothetical protein
MHTGYKSKLGGFDNLLQTDRSIFHLSSNPINLANQRARFQKYIIYSSCKTSFDFYSPLHSLALWLCLEFEAR